jgi:hypothetical protein
MGFKDVLGTISPVAGIATGKGLYGKMADKGLLGMLPRMVASGAQERDEVKLANRLQQEADAKKAAEAQAAQAAMTGGMKPMKKGGKVSSYKSGGKVSSASKRADGCATKGKTKGRMV